MTCIVGLVEQGVIYLGGDSISVSSYNKTLNRDSKEAIEIVKPCGQARKTSSGERTNNSPSALEEVPQAPEQGQGVGWGQQANRCG